VAEFRRKPFGVIRNAWSGFTHFVATEHSSRPHAVVTLAVIAASIALKLKLEEWRWVILAIALVWSAEALNTAIERLSDAVSVEWNERLRFAKDTAAWGVFVAILGAALIILTVFVPRILRLLEQL
jgi:diacylglycerol kinase (ATP)